MAHEVFISYSRKDKAVADAVCAALEGRKIRCWIAPRDAQGGVPDTASVIAAIGESRFMVLILSSSSNDSAQVIREVELATRRGTLVIPFRIEDVSLSRSLQYFIGPVHGLDAFPRPMEHHLNELAGYMERVLESGRVASRPSPSVPPPSAGARSAPPPASAPAPQPGTATGRARSAPPAGEGSGGLLSRAKRALGSLFRSGAERPGDGAADRHRRRSEAPADQVHFSVTSPPAVKPGTSFVINVWAHLAHQRPDMLRRAQEVLGGVQPAVQSKGPARVMRGTLLAVRLRIGELLLEDPEDTISWDGEISNATFGVTAPADVRPGGKPGTVWIYAQGLEIVRIHFAIEVDPATGQRTKLTVTGQPYHAAFASYASEDRDAVLARIQGILKILPELDIFVDVMKLRSGQQWEPALRREIVASDVFYLFWSEYARQSKEVDREWRYALQTRGLDFIDPVPLASPERVPPPPELAAKHFNDWMLAYMRAPRSTVAERVSPDESGSAG